MFLSIIIPVFNAENYLGQCLDSILGSKLDLEIWLINDGSTDSSAELIEKYAKQDSRIHTHHFLQNQRHPSSARNWGIAKSKGEYLAFIDADDYIQPDLLERSLKIMLAKKVDILYCAYRIFNNRNPRQYRIWRFPEHRLFNGNCYFSPNEVHAEFWRNLNSGSCYKVYRRDFLKNFTLEFWNYHFEDLFFSLQSFLLANKIYYLDEALYNYRSQHHSRSSERSYIRCRSGLAGVYKCLNWLKTQNATAIEAGSISLFRHFIRWLQYNLPPSYRKIYIQNISQVLDNFPKINYQYFTEAETKLYQNLQNKQLPNYSEILHYLPLQDALKNF